MTIPVGNNEIKVNKNGNFLKGLFVKPFDLSRKKEYNDRIHCHLKGFTLPERHCKKRRSEAEDWDGSRRNNRVRFFHGGKREDIVV